MSRVSSILLYFYKDPSKASPAADSCCCPSQFFRLSVPSPASSSSNGQTGAVTSPSPSTSAGPDNNAAIETLTRIFMNCLISGPGTNVARLSPRKTDLAAAGYEHLEEKETKDAKGSDMGNVDISEHSFPFSIWSLWICHLFNKPNHYAVQLIKDYGFDGVDLDFEYPGSAAQGQGFADLLTKLRSAFDSLAAKKGDSTPYEISAGAENYANLVVPQMNAALTHWNLMVSLFTGRAFENTDGIGQPYNGIGPGTIEAGVYSHNALPIAGAQIFDEDAVDVASYSYDSAKRELVSYDTPNIVQLKTQYVNTNGMAGNMCWELSTGKKGADSLVGVGLSNLGALQQGTNGNLR
ncbi:hypothetical protein K435DRAFT_803373 [Dendrothele bispora CBS 962.96]|uniref:GH18 domain-containing protein n=1 Tax=Dendrothele bispora (strain CBS 962.96) TaxID=1314807 RepID=A0A4S8LIJ3_DENBC|nr:hypothetical protein K435DRAFT_803373 [Dendrothele bispora CBS 962.96]